VSLHPRTKRTADAVRRLVDGEPLVVVSCNWCGELVLVAASAAMRVAHGETIIVCGECLDGNETTSAVEIGAMSEETA
jgi:hypothetical protein